MQSKRALLAWIKNTLSVDIKTIEELGKGFIYAQLLAKYDSTFSPKNINKNANSEAEYLKNLKLCQEYFTKNKITVFFPIDKMCKCKVQDNLEFLQWLYKYLNPKDANKSFNSSVDNKSSSPAQGMQTPVFEIEQEMSKASVNLGQVPNKTEIVVDNSVTNNKKAILPEQKSKIVFRSKFESSCTNDQVANDKNEILDMYASDNVKCKLCAETKEEMRIYKEKEFYLDSKIKYYESKCSELNTKFGELKARELSLKEKENTLMKQTIINMNAIEGYKDMENKIAIMKDENRLLEILYRESSGKLEEANRQMKEDFITLSEMIKREEANKIDYSSEIEKLKIYYENIIFDNEDAFKDKESHYLKYINDFEIERNTYYRTLKRVEAFLIRCDADEELKTILFKLLYNQE